MDIGYARVSTSNQNLDAQLDALKAAGCEKVLSDVACGARSARPGLDEALAYLRPGDVLVVARLDRLGRSVRHLLQVVDELGQRGVGLRSLHESIDTTTPTGRLVLGIFAHIAEFERELIRERTQEGLASARARGRRGGRPRVMDATKLSMAKTMLEDKSLSPSDIAKTLGVSRTTLYRYVPGAEVRVSP